MPEDKFSLSWAGLSRSSPWALLLRATGLMAVRLSANSSSSKSRRVPKARILAPAFRFYGATMPPVQHRGHPDVSTGRPFRLRILFGSKSPPFHVTPEDVSVPINHCEVKYIFGQQLVRGRGGLSAALYETHRVGLLTPPWEKESDLVRFRIHFVVLVF